MEPECGWGHGPNRTERPAQPNFQTSGCTTAPSARSGSCRAAGSQPPRHRTDRPGADARPRTAADPAASPAPADPIPREPDRRTHRRPQAHPPAPDQPPRVHPKGDPGGPAFDCSWPKISRGFLPQIKSQLPDFGVMGRHFGVRTPAHLPACCRPARQWTPSCHRCCRCRSVGCQTIDSRSGRSAPGCAAAGQRPARIGFTPHSVDEGSAFRCKRRDRHAARRPLSTSTSADPAAVSADSRPTTNCSVG